MTTLFPGGKRHSVGSGERIRRRRGSCSVRSTPEPTSSTTVAHTTAGTTRTTSASRDTTGQGRLSTRGPLGRNHPRLERVEDSESRRLHRGLPRPRSRHPENLAAPDGRTDGRNDSDPHVADGRSQGLDGRVVAEEGCPRRTEITFSISWLRDTNGSLRRPIRPNVWGRTTDSVVGYFVLSRRRCGLDPQSIPCLFVITGLLVAGRLSHCAFVRSRNRGGVTTDTSRIRDDKETE